MAKPGYLVHPPLDHGSRQIRLLHILDKSPGIHCVLKTHNVADPEYVALSYTWGSDHAAYEITINDSRFLVRRNLYDFLVIAREQFPHIVFWIDQICIDQEDTREKNHQVRMMSSIYKNASYVISWLGAASHDSELAISFISSLPHADSWAINNPDPHTWETNSIMGSKYKTWPGHPTNMLPRIRNAVQHLFSRPYWSRLWIVQEVRIAKSVVCLCGAKRVSLQAIKDFILCQDFMWDRESKSVLVSSAVTALLFGHDLGRVHPVLAFMRPLLLDVDDQGERGLNELVKAIYFYCEFQCGDKRDKIYGVLGCIPESEGVVGVDYSKSVEEVFWDFYRPSLDVAFTRRRQPWNVATCYSLREELNMWFHFTASLLKQMGLLNPTMLTSVV